MKILHSADWHLDAPMQGHSQQQSDELRRQLRTVPEKVAKLCRVENCDLLLLAGDLFDGEYTKDSLDAVRASLESLDIPVIITPGNHDFCGENSPYVKENWPDNVHIFREPDISSLYFPELDCRVYGAGYESMDCPGLLKDFHVQSDARWHVGVLHGEAAVPSSNYCPITKPQIQESGLAYLALGHIHKAGTLRAGDTLCAWPGCPMGRGFDELGAKGVLLVELEREVRTAFVPLDTPRFYDEEAEVDGEPLDAVAALLPGVESSDFYRITLTGYCNGVDIPVITAKFPHIPNLQLRDKTLPQTDLWSNTDQDTLEGVYFSLLKEAVESENETLSRRARLAAQISRRILDGQEVKLP